MRKHNATFANFICKFGEDKALLDYAKEIVIPAFKDTNLVREYGDTTRYHFYDVSLINLNKSNQEPILALVGRFIKDTELTRSQVLDPLKGLVKDEQRIKSSPSVFFVLILNNHRLIYFPETSHAPDLTAFQATVRKFLNKKWNEYINDRYKELQEGGSPVTKKQLREENPPPKLEVVPLAGILDIEEFLKRYEKLQKVEFTVLKTNDDIDGSELFKEIRSYFDELEPKTTKVVSSNSDGLNTGKAAEIIHEAVAAGNQQVKLQGYDHEKNKLTASNEDFKIMSPIDDVPTNDIKLAEVLYDRFENLRKEGTVRVDELRENIIRKILNLMNLL